MKGSGHSLATQCLSQVARVWLNFRIPIGLYELAGSTATHQNHPNDAPIQPTAGQYRWLEKTRLLQELCPVFGSSLWAGCEWAAQSDAHPSPYMWAARPQVVGNGNPVFPCLRHDASMQLATMGDETETSLDLVFRVKTTSDRPN